MEVRCPVGPLLCNMSEHTLYMARCLELAQSGAPHARPNPLVGALLVHRGNIVGEGYHRKYGGPHAEVHAIASVSDAELLRSCTLYVNLEPCSHHGKTPPCAELIVRSGIPRMVVAQIDPNPLVAGRGIAMLREAGVEVVTGILESEAYALNAAFNTWHEKGRPYVVLKWAQTADGYMDIDRSGGATGVHWISHPDVQKLVHRWRSECAAILIGARTVHHDNPSLTVRAWSGPQPMRVVLSPSGHLPKGATIRTDGMPTLVLSHCENRYPEPVKQLVLQSDTHLAKATLEALYREGLQSVLIEGGRRTLELFIESGQWDEARIITSPRRMHSASAAHTKAPVIHGKTIDSYRYAGDFITIVKPSRA